MDISAHPDDHPGEPEKFLPDWYEGKFKMDDLVNWAKSRRRFRTSFPRSKITGFLLLKMASSAAKSPAGPAPIIATLFDIDIGVIGVRWQRC